MLADYLEQKFSLVERDESNLHHYQREIAIPFLLNTPKSALFAEMGLGKTAIVLTLISKLFEQNAFNHVLIIAPLRVANRTWPDEIPRWSQSAGIPWYLIRDAEVQEAVRSAGAAVRLPIVNEAKEIAKRMKYDGEQTKELIKERIMLRRDEIDDARREASRPAIRKAYKRNPALVHIINREQVEFLVQAWGKDWPYDCVIIDESTSFADHKSRRFKSMRMVLPFVKRLHLLTATPNAEGYEKLFAQMYLLDKGERLGKNITTYRDRYFSRGYDGFSWKLRYGADEEIAAKISDICLTLKREDWIKDLHDPIYAPRYVELTSSELKVYRKFEKDFVIELPNGMEIEAESAAVLSGKLLQLASGAIYDADKNSQFFHDHKIDELKQIVDELQGEPLLLAYWFKSSLERIKRAFPHAVVMDRKGECIPKWNKGKIQILLVHPNSAGHGLNLQQGGHHLCFFDIPWSFEAYIQLIGRLSRQGQKNAVFLHHIITRNTIDEYVVECLRDKRMGLEALFRYLKQLRKRYKL